MEPIRILYDEQHDAVSMPAIRLKAQEISQRRGIEVTVEYTNGYTLLSKLRMGQRYDVLVLHVGNSFDAVRGAHRIAEECRRYSGAPIVAESSMYPFGKDELAVSFSGYTGPLVEEDNLEQLLVKHNLL